MGKVEGEMVWFSLSLSLSLSLFTFCFFLSRFTLFLFLRFSSLCLFHPFEGDFVFFFFSREEGVRKGISIIIDLFIRDGMLLCILTSTSCGVFRQRNKKKAQGVMWMRSRRPRR